MSPVSLKNNLTTVGEVGEPRFPRRKSRISASAKSFAWRVAAASWAAVIICLSTERFGSGSSRNWETSLLGLLNVHLSAETLRILNLVSRKLAHVAEYGVLCFLLYRSFGNPARIIWQPQLALWSILAAGAYSLTDEFHQLFVPGRGASLIDCAIDTAGALMAMFLLYMLSRLRQTVSEGCASHWPLRVR